MWLIRIFVLDGVRQGSPSQIISERERGADNPTAAWQWSGTKAGEVEPTAPIEGGFGGSDFVASARRHYDETRNAYDNSTRRPTEQRGNRWVLLAASQNGSDANVQGAN